MNTVDINQKEIYVFESWSGNEPNKIGSLYGDNLSLNISSEDSTISVNLALETAQYYNIEENEAKLIIEQILTNVRENWKEIAEKYGINKSNIEYMKWAFSASNS